MVSSRIDEHLAVNNLHEEHLFAYRKLHSTETALVKVQNDILQSLDQNEVAVLVLLDLSAAFDTTDHETLLHRLDHQFGIGDKSLSWMRSYLTDRYQTVFIDGNILKHLRNAPFYILLFLPHGWVDEIFLVIFYVRVQ